MKIAASRAVKLMTDADFAMINEVVDKVYETSTSIGR
jgi:hypothetical protein